LECRAVNPFFAVLRDPPDTPTSLCKESGSKGPGFGLSPEGMIYANAIGKIRNPNIEIRNKFKHQMSQ
jgi:hypothetical protein